MGRNSSRGQGPLSRRDFLAAAAALATGAACRSAGGTAEARRRAGGSDRGKGGIAGAPPAVDGVRARWVAEENARRGTADWRITDVSRRGEIEGYVDRVSAQRGDTIRLYISTEAPSYLVEAYRMGHYGGLGARLVWRSGAISGWPQGEAERDDVTNMVVAPWQVSTRVTLDRSWPPGVYLFKAVANTGASCYLPFTLRDDASTAALVVQNSVTTWQAYNLWGGYSLYEGTSGRSTDFAHRARVVSFDRPYAMGDGSGDFLGNELPLVSLVESLGLDVTYWTDVDLHQRPELLGRHKALLSLGHDEYWSLSMRRGAEAGRDGGVNLVFFGANAIFRQIRFADSKLGADRQVICYKRAREDPYFGVNDDELTIDWRQAPVSNPESSLIGNLYECNPVKADMVIADPVEWLFAGSGLQAGDHIPDVVGPEYDRYTPSSASPDNVQVLAHSPVRCKGQSSYADMTYYTAPSGAGVLATGTNWWISRLESACHPEQCPPNEQVVRITTNLLEVFGAGPAGLVHPSVANYEQLPEAPPLTTPGTSRPTPRSTSRSPSRSRSSDPGIRRPPPDYLEYYEDPGY